MLLLMYFFYVARLSPETYTTPTSSGNVIQYRLAVAASHVKGFSDALFRGSSLTQLKPTPLAGKEEPKDGGDGAYDTLGCVTQRIKGQLSCSKSEIPSPATSVRDIIDALV